MLHFPALQTPSCCRLETEPVHACPSVAANGSSAQALTSKSKPRLEVLTGFFGWCSECLPSHEGGDDPSDGRELHLDKRLFFFLVGDEEKFAPREMCKTVESTRDYKEWWVDG